MVLDKVADRQVRLTTQDVANMTIETFEPIYTEAVKRMKALLEETQGDESHPAAKTLEWTMNEVTAMCGFVGRTIKCKRSHRVIVAGPIVEPAPPADWVGCMKEIALTPSQVQQILTLRTQLKRELLALEAEFIQAVSQIELHSNVRGDSSKPMSKELIDHLTGLERLQSIHHNWRFAIWGFFGQIIRRVFRPYQASIMVVACYPYVPDPLALTACLESQEGEITPSDSLKAASSSSPSDSLTDMLQDYLEPGT
eukprot:jgi/Botrbrau1/16455/Bobra.0142s0051.1